MTPCAPDRGLRLLHAATQRVPQSKLKIVSAVGDTAAILEAALIGEAGCLRSRRSGAHDQYEHKELNASKNMDTMTQHHSSSFDSLFLTASSLIAPRQGIKQCELEIVICIRRSSVVFQAALIGEFGCLSRDNNG